MGAVKELAAFANDGQRAVLMGIFIIDTAVLATASIKWQAAPQG